MRRLTSTLFDGLGDATGYGLSSPTSPRPNAKRSSAVLTSLALGSRPFALTATRAPLEPISTIFAGNTQEQRLISVSKFGSTLRRVVVHTPESWMNPMARAHRLARRRFRRTVTEWQAFLAESERWSQDELDAYALAQLRDLLRRRLRA